MSEHAGVPHAYTFPDCECGQTITSLLDSCADTMREQAQALAAVQQRVETAERERESALIYREIANAWEAKYGAARAECEVLLNSLERIARFAKWTAHVLRGNDEVAVSYDELSAGVELALTRHGHPRSEQYAVAWMEKMRTGLVVAQQRMEEAERERDEALKIMVSSKLEPCTIHNAFQPGCVSCIVKKAMEADALRADLGRAVKALRHYIAAGNRFIGKVRNGRARSVETYNDLLECHSIATDALSPHPTPTAPGEAKEAP